MPLSLPTEFSILFYSWYLRISPLSSNLQAYYTTYLVTLHRWSWKKKIPNMRLALPQFNTLKLTYMIIILFSWRNVRELYHLRLKFRVCLTSSLWVFSRDFAPSYILFLPPSHINISTWSNCPLGPASVCSSLFTARLHVGCPYFFTFHLLLNPLLSGFYF